MVHCLALLLSLDCGRCSEYARALSIALTLWNPEFHDRLLRCCFVEECLEASLSRLAQSLHNNAWAETAVGMSDMYAAVGPPSNALRNLTQPGIPQSLLFTVRGRCRRLLSLISSESVLLEMASREPKVRCGAGLVGVVSG